MKALTKPRRPAELRNEIVMTDADVERLERMLRGIEGPANSLYKYAQALKGEIGRASVVPARGTPPDVVTMNSTVKVRDVKTRKVETYVLAYPWEAGGGVAAGRLSVLAPIGTALLGSRVGDVVTCRAPDGERTLRIESIPFQPEAEGRFDL